MVDFLSELHQAFLQPGVTTLSNLSTITALLERMTATVQENVTVQDMLARLKQKSEIHYHHSLRVGVMFRSGVPGHLEIESCVSPYTLDVVGLLHDYGKTRVPDAVLQKNGSHTAEEQALMRAHNRFTRLSPDMQFLDQNYFPHLIAIAMNHHPYPRKRKEQRQGERRFLTPLPDAGQRQAERRRYTRRLVHPGIEAAGRILEITDKYDALCSKREYKEPFPPSMIRLQLLPQFPADEQCIEYLLRTFPSPMKE